MPLHSSISSGTSEGLFRRMLSPWRFPACHVHPGARELARDHVSQRLPRLDDKKRGKYNFIHISISLQS